MRVRVPMLSTYHQTEPQRDTAVSMDNMGLSMHDVPLSTPMIGGFSTVNGHLGGVPPFMHNPIWMDWWMYTAYFLHLIMRKKTRSLVAGCCFVHDIFRVSHTIHIIHTILAFMVRHVGCAWMIYLCSLGLRLSSESFGQYVVKRTEWIIRWALV